MAKSRRFFQRMKILKGKYRLESRNLTFDVADDLDFQNSSCIYFRGGNGYGKTSFLEKIVIPALKENRLPYLYIGQDIRTQFYTLRAFLSVQGINISGMDEDELLKQWVEHDQTANVLILDEFDKYYPDYGFIFDWTKGYIRTYIIVTHLGMNRAAAAGDRYRICNLKFELINIEDQIKNVRVMYD